MSVRQPLQLTNSSPSKQRLALKPLRVSAVVFLLLARAVVLKLGRESRSSEAHILHHVKAALKDP